MWSQVPLSHLYVFSFRYFTLIQCFLIPLAASVYDYLSATLRPSYSFKSLLFVPLYPSYSHVSPDNFRDSEQRGGRWNKATESERNEVCEVKWGENDLSQRVCVIVEQKEIGEPNDGRRGRRHGTIDEENSRKSHTHKNAYRHTKHKRTK